MDNVTLDDVMDKIRAMQASDVMVPFYNFSAWPMPNSQAQADLTISTSHEISQMHRDGKALISDHLSTLVVEATGQLIFRSSTAPTGPVQWLNHDIVAKQLNATHARAESTAALRQSA
ncbi:hypothetical protein D3C72_1974710 [compost metagenome]